jgi:hypothetical protein
VVGGCQDRALPTADQVISPRDLLAGRRSIGVDRERKLKRAPEQTAIESALAVAADSHGTPTPAFECCAIPESAMQLSRLVAAIEQQTEAHREIGESITGWLQCISNRIEDFGSWVSAGLGEISVSIDDAGKQKATAPSRRTTKPGGRP